MSLADELLELAKKMVNYKKNDILDARLRRAVSTAYYALFHMLLEKGSEKFVAHVGIRQLVSRAYAHSELLKAARTFQSGVGGLPAHMRAPFGPVVSPVPAEIILVATTFIELQGARHEVDYDLSRAFSRSEVKRLVLRADQAFTDWNTVIALPEHAEMCELSLTSLLLSERWKK